MKKLLIPVLLVAVSHGQDCQKQTQCTLAFKRTSLQVLGDGDTLID